jgi:putative phosphoesterase
MRIGVVGDTHRNKEYLSKAVEWMISRQKIGILCHLGDDYDDMLDLTENYIEVLQVPGLYDPRYQNKSLPAKITETVQGLTIMLIHDFDKDGSSSDLLHANIIICAHTHIQEIRLQDGVLFMNPGHLKGPLDKNQSPSFGLIDIQDRNVSAKIFSMDFKQINAMEFLRTENQLYKM